VVRSTDSNTGIIPYAPLSVEIVITLLIVTQGPFVQSLDIPGPLGRFCGFWTTFSNAAYAYSGIDGIATAAAETKNPRRNIPKAAKRILIRVLFFYVISIFILTMLVPSNDPKLLQSTGTAAQSPFVIAANNAGTKVRLITLLSLIQYQKK
jgi:yeast amino acid transporter